MKLFQALAIIVAVSFAAVTAFAATPNLPSFDLEKKIAYQQGQFAALYAHCGSPEERGVIGGSLASWRAETFQGYKGNAEERAGVEQAFDEAARSVAADGTSCKDWIKQAAATWHSIVFLSQRGFPVASNPQQ